MTTFTSIVFFLKKRELKVHARKLQNNPEKISGYALVLGKKFLVILKMRIRNCNIFVLTFFRRDINSLKLKYNVRLKKKLNVHIRKLQNNPEEISDYDLALGKEILVILEINKNKRYTFFLIEIEC